MKHLTRFYYGNYLIPNSFRNSKVSTGFHFAVLKLEKMNEKSKLKNLVADFGMNVPYSRNIP